MFLLLFELFKNAYFQALLFNYKTYVFFFHLSLPHNHKSLRIKTLWTSTGSLKLMVR